MDRFWSLAPSYESQIAAMALPAAESVSRATTSNGFVAVESCRRSNWCLVDINPRHPPTKKKHTHV